MSGRRAAVFALLLLPGLLHRAGAWGKEGHQLIAAIASAHLKPAAALEISRLLDEGETLSSISTWADEIRPQREETAPWHYINLRVDQPGSWRDWKKHCPPSGCVLSAIEEMSRLLSDRTAPRARRAEALKFLVHLVGDLHQPLHSGDRGDRGGNDVEVLMDGQPSSLHRAWDTLLVRQWLDRPGVRSAIERSGSWSERRRLSKGKPAEWAWEAREAARLAAYDPLSNQQPAVLDERYLQQAGPVISLQCRRAGYRLARLLNRLLGQ
mgnify:CR=1 FL=1